MKQKNSIQAVYDSVRGSENWLYVHPLNSGDSADQKYLVCDKQNQQYFLKISEPAHYLRREQEFMHLQNLYAKYACVPRPLDFGACLNGKHSFIFSQWAAGVSVDRLLQMDSDGRFGRGNPEHDRYCAGVDFGVIMQEIHTPLSVWYQSADIMRLKAAADQALQTTVDQLTGQAEALRLADLLGIDLAALIKERLRLLPSSTPCLLHGDIKMEHAIMTPLHGLLMTDFSDWSFGHPHAELAKMLIDFRTVNKNFLTGVLDGYFSHRLNSRQLFSLSFYMALSLVQRLVTAANPAGRQSKQLARSVLRDFNGFRSAVPDWYQLHI